MNAIRGNRYTSLCFTNRSLLIAGAGLLLLSTAANAQVDSKFAACAAIKDSAKRLACFDQASTPAPATPAVPATTAPIPAAKPTVAVPAPIASPAPAPVTPEVDDFGAETVRKKSTDEPAKPQSITARITGEFTGWEPGTLFTFENGQVWKYVGGKSVYYPRKDPKIQIEKSVLGAYWLSVEGLNSKARVRRIK